MSLGAESGNFELIQNIATIFGGLVDVESLRKVTVSKSWKNVSTMLPNGSRALFL